MKKIGLVLSIGLLLITRLWLVSAEYDIDFDVYSEYVYMIDLDNHQVIFNQGSSEKIYPASMTKIMTLIVAIENMDDPSKKIVLKPQYFAGFIEANASMAGFSVNETVTLEDCLYGLFLPSGAECARALAIETMGSEEAFIEKMNQKANELSMVNTSFTNTTGLHDVEHYTSLYDLSLLIQYCMENELFMEIFTAKEYTATYRPTLQMQSNLFKSLKLIHEEDTEIVGGKTGYTNLAGLCLASIAEKDGRRYLLITANAPVSKVNPYHVMDGVAIHQRIFNQYTKVVIENSTTSLMSVKVKYNFSHSSVNLVTKELLELTIPNGINVNSLRYETNIPDVLEAPLSSDEVVAEMHIYSEDTLIMTVDLYPDKTISRNEFLVFMDKVIQFILNNWLWIVGLLTVAIALLMMKRQSKRRRKIKWKRKKI